MIEERGGEWPDLAALAGLIGDRSRTRMLAALMSGLALTATELAAEAEVASSTASSHLAKLADAGIVTIVIQGRHRYFRLTDDSVAAMLENMMGIAARNELSSRGPSDPALRAARICYDHLAGAAGVWMTDQLLTMGVISGRDAFEIRSEGVDFFRHWGIDVDRLSTSRRPLCRCCLDWSERRYHLAGALGAAIMERIFALGWARRERGSRIVTFSPMGERAFRARFESEPAKVRLA